MAQVGMHEAKTQLSKLVAMAEAGEDVVIARNGKPAVRLVAVESLGRRERRFGALRGRIRVADDFDEIPPEFDEYLV